MTHLSGNPMTQKLTLDSNVVSVLLRDAANTDFEPRNGGLGDDSYVPGIIASCPIILDKNLV